MELGFELEGWDRVAENWHRAPELFQAELSVWAEALSGYMTDEIVKITPRREGYLQESIKPVLVDVSNLGVTVLIGTPLNYAVPVEFGSKPHDITPKSGKALHFVFHGVEIFAKRIHHPGMKGYFMFKDALDANKEQIRQSFNATLDRIWAQLGGHA